MYKIYNSKVLNSWGCQYFEILRTDIKTNFNRLFPCGVVDIVVLYRHVLYVIELWRSISQSLFDVL